MTHPNSETVARLSTELKIPGACPDSLTTLQPTSRAIGALFPGIPAGPLPMPSPAKLDIRPAADEAHSLFAATCQASPRPTLLPLCITIPSDLLTPSAIYLKLSNGYGTNPPLPDQY